MILTLPEVLVARLVGQRCPLQVLQEEVGISKLKISMVEVEMLPKVF